MNALQELNMEEALQAAFEAGWKARKVAEYQASWSGRVNVEAPVKPDYRSQQIEAQIKLVNAVGQTVQGLANLCDNWRSA